MEGEARSQKSRQPPEAVRGEEMESPRASGRNAVPPAPWYWPAVIQFSLLTPRTVRQ